MTESVEKVALTKAGKLLRDLSVPALFWHDHEGWNSVAAKVAQAALSAIPAEGEVAGFELSHPDYLPELHREPPVSQNYAGWEAEPLVRQSALTAAHARIAELEAELLEVQDGRDELANQFAIVCAIADDILAPICAATGRSIASPADCPDMIEELSSEGVVIPAKHFSNLYDATHPDKLEKFGIERLTAWESSR